MLTWEYMTKYDISDILHFLCPYKSIRGNWTKLYMTLSSLSSSLNENQQVIKLRYMIHSYNLHSLFWINESAPSSLWWNLCILATPDDAKCNLTCQMSSVRPFFLSFLNKHQICHCSLFKLSTNWAVLLSVAACFECHHACMREGDSLGWGN